MPASEQEICHDLKTERTDVGQPLPQVMRLLPIAFFGTVVASALLSTVFLLRYRAAETAKSEWLAKEAQFSRELKTSEGKVEDIKLETVKAEEAATWVEGTRSIQEVVLAITRSMESGITDTTLGNLSITRQEEDPAKLAFAVKVDGSRTDVPIQLDEILKSLNGIKYSPYAARQSVGKKTNGLNYEATLIRTETR
ncbi:hypothetical protein OAF27_00435 [Verrucomicrobiales bacterium]|nr:hypothetical protein [Verrucomicrobiales bacterium]